MSVRMITKFYEVIRKSFLFLKNYSRKAKRETLHSR